jgi:uncharacterized DUF497 family protein
MDQFAWDPAKAAANIAKHNCDGPDRFDRLDDPGRRDPAHLGEAREGQ